MIENKTIFIAHSWADTALNQQSKALALHLSKTNKVYFLSAKKTGCKRKSINEKLLVFEWPGKRPTGLRDFLFAQKLMLKYKPDIIITNFAANDIMLITSWLAKIKVRMCYYHTMVEQYIADHHYLPFSQRVNIIRKGFAFRFATHMLPSTSASKRDLIKYYKVDEKKVFVFPNAINNSGLINNGNHDTTIGFIGRLDYSKGVDILLEAFKYVTTELPGIKLNIVGSGMHNETLVLQAKSIASAKIVFKGVISYDKVFQFLSNIHFLIVPSRTDNLPTVIVEAFSVRTPVVASNAGGIPDMVTDNYNGLLFECENAKHLADKIIWLLKNNVERKRLADNAYFTFQQKFCIDNLPGKFEELLKTTGYLT